jgi:CheY-like chemotaxis protein
MQKTRPAPIVALADCYRDEMDLYTWSLEALGYTVVPVDSDDAVDAAATIVRIKPDIVVTRIRPGRFGIDLTWLLRRTAAGSDIPVLAITTYTDARLHHEARAAGVSDVHLLPLLPEALVAAVRKHVGVAKSHHGKAG